MKIITRDRTDTEQNNLEKLIGIIAGQIAEDEKLLNPGEKRRLEIVKRRRA